MTSNIEKIVASAFSSLSKASARKKVYAKKAMKEGHKGLSQLLRAISESESVQARRLFNSLRGQIDKSDRYVSTIFEKEIEGIIGEYSEDLRVAEQESNKAITQMLYQLRTAEKRMLYFYAKETKDIKTSNTQKYFVCQFCGYISPEKPPERCPICGVSKIGFQEVR